MIVFEGHPTALVIRCRGADVLILDDAMLPHPQADWLEAVLVELPNQRILIFKRDGKLNVYKDGQFT